MVTHEEILNIANLAKLYVPEEELGHLTEEMNTIISFAHTVNSVATEASDFDNINNISNAFREDVVVPSLPQEKILENAESQEDGYFLVKKRV